MLFIVILMRSPFPRGTANWRLIFLIGFLNIALPFFLISWGQQFISSAASALLMASGTFCAVLVSHYTSHDERINRYRVLGVVIGFAGGLIASGIFAGSGGTLAGIIWTGAFSGDVDLCHDY